MLKKQMTVGDSTGMSLNELETMLSKLKIKGLGEATMSLERICALLDTRRKDYSNEHLVNGSLALPASVMDYLKNVANTFVEAMVGSASSAAEGEAGGSGGGSGESKQPSPKKKKVSRTQTKGNSSVFSGLKYLAPVKLCRRGPQL